jgi:hypothetical protein
VDKVEMVVYIYLNTRALRDAAEEDGEPIMLAEEDNLMTTWGKSHQILGKRQREVDSDEEDPGY